MQQRDLSFLAALDFAMMRELMPSDDVVFEKAVLCTADAEREALLSLLCGGDMEQAGRVRMLLLAHFAAGAGFMASPSSPGFDEQTLVLGGTDGTLWVPLEQAAKMIGPYRLLQDIGQGGLERYGWRSRRSRCGAKWR